MPHNKLVIRICKKLAALGDCKILQLRYALQESMI